MYYEERVIDGRLCFRSAPDDEWTVISWEQVLTRLEYAENWLQTYKRLAKPDRKED